ncbi:MAG: inositol 2-dehydrogenase [Acidobacteria bacterium]|nr:MAG: inositol 2-dehydrogenase [Acidobacteriota bacterium]
MNARLNIGVIGLGRLGRVYAEDLARYVPAANLVAVADTSANVAERFAKEYGVPKWYESHRDLLHDSEVAAVAVITPTSTHKDVVVEAANRGKAIFCEKPISLSIAEAKQMLDTTQRTGVFLQMGFQRRFDAGYIDAKKKIEAGIIGTPVLISLISRDPFAPPLEFCNPKASGGLIIDMGIHDFDLARMFVGEVASVYSTGGALAYPEMKSIGDIDNAAVNLVFQNGALGVVQLSRNAVFGYDIRTEIWGTKGSLQIGYFRHTPVLVMTKDGISHDVVPHFMQRFEKAYLAQIRDFVDNVLKGAEPSISGEDALAALQISLAATQSLKENQPVTVRMRSEVNTSN